MKKNRPFMRNLFFSICVSFLIVNSVDAVTFQDEAGKARVEVSGRLLSGPFATPCISLTNVSLPPANPRFPLKIIAFGFYGGQLGSELLLINQVDSLGVFSNFGSLPGGVAPTSQVLVALTDVSRTIDHGIDIGQTVISCMTLTSATALTHEELLNRFFVVLDDGVSHCRLFHPSGSDAEEAMVDVTIRQDNEILVKVSNHSKDPASVITGVGFALPWERNSYYLPDNDPVLFSQSNGMRFFFSSSRGRLRLPENLGISELSFGVLTGGTFERGLTQFGIPALVGLTSSGFNAIVQGRFDELDAREIISGGVVRFPESYRTAGKVCPEFGGNTGGVRGTVATNPQ